MSKTPDFFQLDKVYQYKIWTVITLGEKSCVESWHILEKKKLKSENIKKYT
jgi:hypothetical protein